MNMESHTQRGMFITVEGPEGSGKTTVSSHVYEALLKEGVKIIHTREPGGIAIAEQIREVILDKENIKMDGRTEALLYAAARRQHLIEKVIPALESGTHVICDRFLDSSLAYQGWARGIGLNGVLSINEFAIEGCMPDMTLFFDLPPSVGMERIAKNKQREVNRLDLETIQFHEKVYEGYKEVEKMYSGRIVPINASIPLVDVQRIATGIVKNFLIKHC